MPSSGSSTVLEAQPRLRVGVVGCGTIAQAMHLPYLTKQRDRFELVALCDLDRHVVQACGDRFGVERTFVRADDLLACDLDAVVVATAGDHQPICLQAASRGLHVLVEKPMVLSSRGGEELLAAAARAGVVLMVGTMKRYDPAASVLREWLKDALPRLRLISVTTLEAPAAPYLAHHDIVRPAGPPPASDGAPGCDPAGLDPVVASAGPEVRWCYQHVLLDNLVHELNLLRGMLGEPDRLTCLHLTRRNVELALEFDGVPCRLSWADVPGLARYRQELAFVATDTRCTLSFPSPYLRHAPTELVMEGGEAGSAHTWQQRVVCSFEEAFEQELIEFHASVAAARDPRTGGSDGLRDVALCEAIVHSHVHGETLELGAAAAPVAGRG